MMKRLIALMSLWRALYGRGCIANAENDHAALPIPEEMTLRIHYNGEADPCGSVQIHRNDWYNAAAEFSRHNSDDAIKLDKYNTESLLTHIVTAQLDESGSCANFMDPSPEHAGFGGFCDRGEEYTPILNDHKSLVKTPDQGLLPCRFFTRVGVRIASVQHLMEEVASAGIESLSSIEQTCLATDMDDKDCQQQQQDTGIPSLDLYAVSAGRVFMFAPKYVGEIFQLPHIQIDQDGNSNTGATSTNTVQVYLKVLNLQPRVLDIYHFFSKSESAALVERALAETSPTHRIKRSTTGTGEHSVFSKRTSENGFDTHGMIAQKIKKRCMKVLGFDEYIEGHTDGLQVLRYNQTTAYTPHMDYMDDRSGRELHDYDSAHKGGNRYATILLYMSDMGERDGGETVFSKAWPPELAESERQPLPQALEELRNSGDASMVTKGSWEEEMVATCRSKLSVRPNSARAVLFYSQHPDGREDLSSRHGGCPVLHGEKWAANLWVWNTPREGFDGSPVKPHIAAERARQAKNNNGQVNNSNKPKQIKATWTNTGKDPQFVEAELYFDESGYWGKLGHGDKPLYANTYEGHRWNIKVGDKFVRQFVIGKEPTQAFTI